MNDGRPLTLQLVSDAGRMRLSFTKASEGLWAEGPVQVCRRAARVTASIARADLTLGPAANWVMRQVLSTGATFELSFRETGRLRVETTGWGGEFEAAD